MEINSIHKKTKIIGDINSEGDFRVDGTLEGNLITKGRVIIGAVGFVKGIVKATDMVVEGEFFGELNIINSLIIKATAKINGSIEVRRLYIEQGALFNATCKMKPPKVVEKIKEKKKNNKKSAIKDFLMSRYNSILSLPVSNLDKNET